MKRLFQYLYQKLIEPHSTNADDRRQEYLLNVILVSLLLVAIIAALTASIDYLVAPMGNRVSNLVSSDVFVMLIAGLLALSRRNHFRQASGFLVGLIGFIILQLLLGYGYLLPEVGLGFAMVAVISGVLLKARTGLIVTISLAVIMLTVTYLQVTERLHPDFSWRTDKPVVADAYGLVGTIAIIGIVSWLANREIDRSLDRARRSEAALALERNNLEVTVAQRSRELEAAQLSRTVELQRFAEFGRLTANLLHEVANPLTAASLNLELADDQQSEVIARARKNLQHLERYVTAARQQLKAESSNRLFSPRAEVAQSLRLLKPLARKAGINLAVMNKAPNYKLFGDPVKFSQIVANIIANALDSYDGTERPNGAKQIEITLTEDPETEQLLLTVKDWGKGISKSQQEHIFEPFYTTKAVSGRGMGIGLALVKQFVEQEFGGAINVSSSTKSGTTFSVSFAKTAKSVHEPLAATTA